MVNEMPDAGQLGTVDDVINLINMFCSAMYTVLPFIGCCLAFYVCYRVYKKQSKKKQIKKQIKQQQKIMKQNQKKVNKQLKKIKKSKAFASDDEMLNRLYDTKVDTYSPRFDSLTLEFDKDGRAKGV